ncbi:ribonuclease III [Corynebacterium auriscanis]|uniref:ribonuclease III n=1 Tax=Corynebacterium auriscanis TaxID=99807 RepID=UPI003CF733D4
MARKRRLTGEAALNAAYTKTDHTPLRKAWGVDISDDYLRLALTHRSFANENDNLPNNERLEFLGDAVLGLAVAEQLYRQFPDRTESEISKMRAGVVNMYALADVARELGVGPNVLLGRGEMRTGGDDKHSILSDTVEAILGAIYLEHGFQTARETVLRIFEQRITAAPTVGLTMDWKTVLVEKLSDLGLGDPVYASRGEGPEHNQTFHARLVVTSKRLQAEADTVTPESVPSELVYLRTTGEGHTKKEAEHAAAKVAVAQLNKR